MELYDNVPIDKQEKPCGRNSIVQLGLPCIGSLAPNAIALESRSKRRRRIFDKIRTVWLVLRRNARGQPKVVSGKEKQDEKALCEQSLQIYQNTCLTRTDLQVISTSCNGSRRCPQRLLA